MDPAAQALWPLSSPVAVTEGPKPEVSGARSSSLLPFSFGSPRRLCPGVPVPWTGQGAGGLLGCFPQPAGSPGLGGLRASSTLFCPPASRRGSVVACPWAHEPLPRLPPPTAQARAMLVSWQDGACCHPLSAAVVTWVCCTCPLWVSVWCLVALSVLCGILGNSGATAVSPIIFLF